MRKSNKKGFTLVELVVVIAIIGVLAAILIPTMLNYVKKSRMRTANSNAKLIFTTMNNMASDKLADGDDVGDLITGPVKVSSYSSANADTLEGAVWAALKDNGENGSGWMACDFQPNVNDHENWAQWQTNGTTGNQITGQWPNPPKSVEKAEGLTFGTYDANAAT